MAIPPRLKSRFFSSYRIFIPLFGLFVGMVKVVGVKGEVALFRAFGVSDLFRVVFGLIQAGGALMLFSRKSLRVGVYICIATLCAASCLMVYNGIFNVLPIPVVGIGMLWAYLKAFS